MQRILCFLIPALVLAPLTLAEPAGAARPARFVPAGTMERAAVPEDHKWDLRPLFADDAAFEAGLAEAAAGRARVAAFAGKLADPEQLAACLEAYFATRLLTNRATLYAAMRFDTDQSSTALRALRDRAQDALHQLMQASAFIRQEVLALDDGAGVGGLDDTGAQVHGLARGRRLAHRDGVVGRHGERDL